MDLLLVAAAVERPVRFLAQARLLRSHGRKLARLGLMPADLHEPSDLATALRWTGRRVPLVAAGVIALARLLLVTGLTILADPATRARPPWGRRVAPAGTSTWGRHSCCCAGRW